MSAHRKAIGIVVTAALLLAGCASQGTGSVSSSTGSTIGSGSGSGSGTVAPVRDPSDSEKDRRANTPPGMDRDGHGPAAGAIVDPTGAATASKPY